MSGEEFDSSVKRGTPATFKPNQVVKGWTEALQLMRAGDKWKLWLPSELGYGDSGAGGKIPGGAVLVFELELLEVKESSGGLLDMLPPGLADNPMLLVMIGGMVLYTLYNSFFGGGGAGGKGVDVSEVAGAEGNVHVFLDIKIGEREPERLELELFTRHCPKTAENFRALCTGEKGMCKTMKSKPLHFKGSKFHRVIGGFMAQGGDFTHGSGIGGESIYGAKFADEWENGYIRHSKGNLLSMANAGPNTNGSQFFLTFRATPHLNGKHVVFGQVVSGAEIVKGMEKVGSGSGATSEPVLITDSGEVKTKST